MSPLTAIHRELDRLHRLTTTLLVIGALIVLGTVIVTFVELREIRSHQAQLEELTDDLCGTLERAGIVIQGSRENPCER